MNRPKPTYNGSKAGNGTYQNIINFIPKCDVFIDAMVGNGGIVCNLKYPSYTIINDIDAGVIDGFDADGHGITKENLCVLDLIDKYDQRFTNAFFYFDPPYLKSTRKNQKSLYRHEWDLEDHQKFIAKVLTVKNNCMISHYPNAWYAEAFEKWNQHLFWSTTRNGRALECIYMNYEAPSILQDYRYLGKDFTDRQRIKRKIARWLKNLDAMPEVERAALLRSIIDKYNFTSDKLLNGL